MLAKTQTENPRSDLAGGDSYLLGSRNIGEIDQSVSINAMYRLEGEVSCSYYLLFGANERLTRGDLNDLMPSWSFTGFYPIAFQARASTIYKTHGGINFSQQFPLTIIEKKNSVKTNSSALSKCHTEFYERLDNLIKRGEAELSNDLYDDISEMIYNYDHCIDQVPNNISDLFFNYSNLLEAIFIAMKRRHASILSAKNILTELEHIYTEIYSCIVSSNCNNISFINKKINDLETRAINEGLMPTVEECEEEMEETFASMSGEEKEDLARLLRKD